MTDESFRQWIDMDQRLGKIYRDAARGEIAPANAVIVRTIDACFASPSSRTLTDVAFALIRNLTLLADVQYKDAIDKSTRETISILRSDGSFVVKREESPMAALAQGAQQKAGG